MSLKIIVILVIGTLGAYPGANLLYADGIYARSPYASTNWQGSNPMLSSCDSDPLRNYYSIGTGMTFTYDLTTSPHSQIMVSMDLFLRNAWALNDQITIIIDSQTVKIITLDPSQFRIPLGYCGATYVLYNHRSNQMLFTIFTGIWYTNGQPDQATTMTIQITSIGSGEIRIANVITQYIACAAQCLTCSGPAVTTGSVTDHKCQTCSTTAVGPQTLQVGSITYQNTCVCSAPTPFYLQATCLATCPTSTLTADANNICSLSSVTCAMRDLTGVCVSCSINYPKKYLGNCYPICPTNSVDNSDVCTPKSTMSQYGSEILMEAFLDFQIDPNVISQFTFTPSSPSDTTNQLTGQIYSVLSTSYLLGGYGVWFAGTYSVTFQISQPHYQIQIWFTRYCNDGCYGQFTLTADNVIVLTDLLSVTSGTDTRYQTTGFDQNIDGYLQFSHTASSVTLKFSFFSTLVGGDAFSTSLGIGNLCIYANQCMTNCVACTSSICTLCTNSYQLIYGQCIICSTNYNRDSSCNCLKGYYDNGSSTSCLQCYSACKTCITKSTNCLSCNNSLNLKNAPNCDTCIDGYYMSSQSCISCPILCITCNAWAECKTCASPRINPPQCSCPDGYLTDCITKCSIQCVNCLNTVSTCSTCAGNRINPPACSCPDGSIQTTAFCSSCSIAQPTAQFSDDLNSIVITFQFNLTSIISQSIFDSATLLQIGLNPSISGQQNTITIKLGDGATIAISSTIGFQNNSLTFANCTFQISNIVNPVVQMPTNQLIPSLILNANSFTTTTCDNVIISIVSSTQNGQRSIKLNSWSIQDATNSDGLQAMITNWNTNLTQTSFVVTSNYLEQQSSINLVLSFENFISIQSSQKVQIFVKQQTLSLKIQVPSQAYIFNQIVITILSQLTSCTSSISNQSISIKAQVSNSTTTLNYNFIVISGIQSQITFPAYSLTQGSTYGITASASSLLLTSSNSQSFTVQAADIKVSIQGGDQQIGINQVMNITGQIFNPNTQTQSLNLSQYTMQWLCKDINAGQACTSFVFNQLQATFNTTNMKPYSTLQITFQAKLNGSPNFQKSSININLLDGQVNQIELDGNQFLLNFKVNAYDQIDIKFQYTAPIAFDIDQLTYTSSYLDGSYSQNLYQFYYLQTTIKVKQFLNLQFTTNCKFKVTIKHPQYPIPSIATLSITINVPPQSCQLQIFPRLNQYNLQVSSCISDSLPLQYQFIYYSSITAYQADSNAGIIVQGIYLNQYSISPQLITYLSGNNSSIIMAIVKDSLNGLSNITMRLTSVQFINSTIYSLMLQDTNINIVRNIFMILNDVLTNNGSLSTQLSSNITNLINQQNQSDPTVIYSQQQLIQINQNQISASAVQQQFTTSLDQLNSQSSLLNSIQEQQIAGQYNPNYQLQLTQIQSSIFNIGNYLSTLYSASQSSTSTRMLQAVQNTTTSVTQGVSNITSILGALSKVNQNAQLMNTSQFNLSAQKFSTQMINQNIGVQVINQPNITVKFSNQEFKINPYQNDSNFKNQVQAPLIIPELTSLANDSIQVKPANPIPFHIPYVGNVNIQCASKIGSSWSVDVCQLIQTPTLECLCQNLTPLSIMFALEYIFGQFGQLFSTSISSKISSFSYYYVLFTYILLIFIIGYFIFLYIVYQKDSVNKTSVQPIKINQVENIDNLRQEIEIKVTSNYLEFHENSLLSDVQQQKVSIQNGFLIFLKNTHMILELYYRFDDEEPRILRLSLLFLQILGQITIFTLFGKNINVAIVIGLAIFQTAYGIVYQQLLSRMIKSKNERIQKIGLIIAVLLTGFCAYLIIASIALYATVYDANIAGLAYLGSFALDYLINNIIVQGALYALLIKKGNNIKYKKIYALIFTSSLQKMIFGYELNPAESSSKGQ